MKTGLFFGSFNPIHNGHLSIADYMLKHTDLAEIWFVVSPQNPLKKENGLLADNKRLELEKEAIKENQNYRAIDIEFKMPKPSYTIDTLHFLAEKFPEHKFAVIMGSDNLESLSRWKKFEEIVSGFEIYVYPRSNHEGGELKNHSQVKLVNAPLMTISATFLREAINENQDVKDFFPDSVWKIIKEKNLYRK
jgi:nicotinate-nucleotide adenylyltransferase